LYPALLKQSLQGFVCYKLLFGDTFRDRQISAYVPFHFVLISLAGGGAGGSVWVKCDELDGYGSITSNGGSGANNAGGGSGGRIALYYKKSDYNGTISAYGGIYLIAETPLAMSTNTPNPSSENDAARHGFGCVVFRERKGLSYSSRFSRTRCECPDSLLRELAADIVEHQSLFPGTHGYSTHDVLRQCFSTGVPRNLRVP